jgi:sugar-specific transcriptional regulator TrmB
LREGLFTLNRELLAKTLAGLGLTEIDAEIYAFLAKEGSQKGRDIAGVLNLYKQQLYRSLKRLQKKGIVTATVGHPAHFSAMPLDKALDILIEAKKEQALALQTSRKELLSSWRSMIGKDSSNS